MRIAILISHALCLLLLCVTQPCAAEQKMATLNLKDADINTLIGTVGEITGRNFVVDPRVKGKVTVISSAPMTADGIYQTFLAILAVHGYAAVPSGQVIEIIPEVTAKQQGGVPVGGQGAPGEEVITRVVKVNNVPAAQLVPILRPLIPQYGHLAAYPPSNMLIVSDRAANVERIVAIVKRLDNQGNHQVVVLPLAHASAADVVVTLGQIIQQGGGEKSATPPPTVVADERTNSVVLSGSSGQIARLRQVIRKLDAPIDQTGGDTQVVYLHYADAENLAKVLNSYLQGVAKQQRVAGKAAPRAESDNDPGTTSVVPAKDINALVISASPETMRALKSIIAQLDIQRSQVLVQAVIAEVSANSSRQLGVNWAAFNDDRIAAASLPGLDGGTIGQIGSASAEGSSGALLGLLQPGGLTLGGGVLNRGGTSFAVLLRALSSDADTNILSTPTLVTMDNQEAEITVGKEVPFLTGSYASTGLTDSSVNPFQTIERKQVGLTLKLTPQINKGDTVQLEIDQEVSSLSSESSLVNAVDLITNNRNLKTTVNVQDGDILVLGGLIDNNVRSSVHAVPLLSDIPLLGSLFRYRTYNRDKRNLMVFIRPVIIRDRRVANYYTRQKYQTMRDVQLRTRASAGGLLGEHELPVMPELEEFRDTLPLTTPAGSDSAPPGSVR